MDCKTRFGQEAYAVGPTGVQHRLRRVLQICLTITAKTEILNISRVTGEAQRWRQHTALTSQDLRAESSRASGRKYGKESYRAEVRIGGDQDGAVGLRAAGGRE